MFRRAGKGVDLGPADFFLYIAQAGFAAVLEGMIFDKNVIGRVVSDVGDEKVMVIPVSGQQAGLKEMNLEGVQNLQMLLPAGDWPGFS